jgi:hypothetical protein
MYNSGNVEGCAALYDEVVRVVQLQGMDSWSHHTPIRRQMPNGRLMENEEDEDRQPDINSLAGSELGIRIVKLYEGIARPDTSDIQLTDQFCWRARFAFDRTSAAVGAIELTRSLLKTSSPGRLNPAASAQYFIRLEHFIRKIYWPALPETAAEIDAGIPVVASVLRNVVTQLRDHGALDRASDDLQTAVLSMADLDDSSTETESYYRVTWVLMSLLSNIAES